MSDSFARSDIEKYLKELSKEFRKLNKKNTEAEIIIIGGASALLNYNFRESTKDIDAYIKASSAMKDAIRIIRDRYNLENDWFNDDFKKTSSFSPKLAECAKYYKTFSNVVHIYTISGAYLIAMKLMSGRPYKFDQSDVIGILGEHKKRNDPILLNDIKQACERLYGTYEAIPLLSRDYLEGIFNEFDIDKAYQIQRKEEEDNKELLVQFEQDYEDILTSNNINDILASLKDRK